MEMEFFPAAAGYCNYSFCSHVSWLGRQCISIRLMFVEAVLDDPISESELSDVDELPYV